MLTIIDIMRGAPVPEDPNQPINPSQPQPGAVPEAPQPVVPVPQAPTEVSVSFQQPEVPAPAPISPEVIAPTADATPQLVAPVEQPAPAVVSPQVAAPQPAVAPTVPITPEQVAPGVPQPASPQVDAAPVYAAAPAKKKAFVPLLIAVIVVVVLALGGLGYFVLSHKITKKDVTTADTATETMNTDLNDAITASNKLYDAADKTAATGYVSTFTAKLADANKQYTVLKNSKVLGDADVKKAFTAVDAKWPAYAAYLQNSTSDLALLEPVSNTFEASYKKLTTPTTAAQVPAYLTSFKGIIDTTTTSVGSLKLSLPENQKAADAFKAYLQAASTAIAAAQADLTAGKPVYQIETDLFKADTAQTTYYTASVNAISALEKKQNSLDPTHQFNDFIDALNKLAAKTH